MLLHSCLYQISTARIEISIVLFHMFTPYMMTYAHSARKLHTFIHSTEVCVVRLVILLSIHLITTCGPPKFDALYYGRFRVLFFMITESFCKKRLLNIRLPNVHI